MIMKLDHVSYITQRKRLPEILEGFEENSKLYFQEIDRDNFRSKWDLMHDKQEKYDMYFYEGRTPVEVISYEAVHKGEHLNVNTASGSFCAKSNNLSECADILGRMGIKIEVQNNDVLKCNIKGVLDREDYWLTIVFAEHIDTVYLDDEGFGCITFLVDSIEKLRDVLSSMEGVDLFTDSEAAIINNRKLRISFLRLRALNVIFEFITPAKRTSR